MPRSLRTVGAGCLLAIIGEKPERPNPVVWGLLTPSQLRAGTGDAALDPAAPSDRLGRGETWAKKCSLEDSAC